jgi:hypothetical protein
MKSFVYLAGAVAAAALMACGGAPADFEGASNTDPVVEDRACEKLAACCAGLPEQQQGMCLGGARSAEASECTVELNQLRGSGTCR